MKIFSIFPFSLVGIDIQRNGISLVKLKKIRKTFLLKEAHFRTLPLEIFVGDQIEKWDLLSSLLDDFVASLNLQGETVAMSLPVNLVRMDRIRLPMGMTNETILEEIHAHVHHDLRELNETLCIDYTELSKCSLYSHFIFAVARESYLRKYIDCVQRTGLKVRIVDIDIYALVRSIKWHESLSENKTQAIFYAVNQDAKLIVFNHQEIIFYHQWDISDPRKWIIETKHALDLCLAGFPQMRIEKLAICRFPHEELTPSEKDLFEPIEIYYPRYFEKINFSEHLDSEFIKNQASYFLGALGCAMREVPKWLR